ncbi:MAG: hypothetical protein VYD90_13150 [Pseudomonadota bacterium]|nr:hypothetical protein [Pseudomonadota bacterium]
MSTISGLSVPIATAIIPGGASGEHAVPGNLTPDCALLSVLHVSEGAPPAVEADLTSEFSITAGASGTIENTTTDTTGDFLIVTWALAE